MWDQFNRDDFRLVSHGKKSVPEYHQKYSADSAPLPPQNSRPSTPRDPIGAVPGIFEPHGATNGFTATREAKEVTRFHSATHARGSSAPRSSSAAPYEWVETPRESVRSVSVERKFSSTPETRDLFRFEASPQSRKQRGEYSQENRLTISPNQVSHSHRYDGVHEYGPQTKKVAKDVPQAPKLLEWAPISPTSTLGKAKVCKIALYSGKSPRKSETPVTPSASSAPSQRPSHDKSVEPVKPRLSTGSHSKERSESERWLTNIGTMEQERSDGRKHLQEEWRRGFQPEKRPALSATEVVSISSPRRVSSRRIVTGCHMNRGNSSQEPNQRPIAPYEWAPQTVPEPRSQRRRIVPSYEISKERSRSASGERQSVSIVPGLSHQSLDTPRTNGGDVPRRRSFDAPTESALLKSKKPNLGSPATVHPKPSTSYVNMIARRECASQFSKDTQFRSSEIKPQPNPRCYWTNAQDNMRNSVH